MDASLPIRTLPVLLVDCQTTGATPERSEILDLAWARVTAATADGVDSCVDGGLLELDGELPSRIARITGVTDDDLIDATPREQMREAFLAAVNSHDGPVVAHFAQFERRFLEAFIDEVDWRSRLLCTHSIARRLLPELPRLGIRALSGYFGESMHEDKRARGHVAATARIWSELVELLDEEGVENLDELEAWLENTNAPARSSRVRRFPLPREQRLGLPDVPGVYRMLGRDRVVLYVGKATSLKSRVNSYYRGRKGEGERKLELVTQVWDLDITRTATPLHAAVLEQREIKSHEPPYNRQFRSRHRAIAWFDPRDLSQVSPVRTERHTLGPVPSERSFDGARWLVARHRGESVDLPFGEIDDDVIAAGLEQFAMEAEGLGVAPDHWPDPFALARLGAHYRRLEAESEETEETDDVDEADGELHDDDEPRTVDDWTPDDIVEYARWLVRGVDRTIRRAHAFAALSDGTLEWVSPVNSERSQIAWRSGRVVDLTEQAGVGGGAGGVGGFDLEAFDETAVLIGELKRLIRYEAEFLLETPLRSFDRAGLQAYFESDRGGEY